MIHEYAEGALGGEKGIRRTTGISMRAQKRLTKAANCLSPLDRGPHAKEGEKRLMTLAEQRVLISELLRCWIGNFAHSAG